MTDKNDQARMDTMGNPLDSRTAPARVPDSATAIVKAAFDVYDGVIDGLLAKNADLLAQRDALLTALKQIRDTYTCVCRHGKKCCNTIDGVSCPKCIAHAAIELADHAKREA